MEKGRQRIKKLFNKLACKVLAAGLAVSMVVTYMPLASYAAEDEFIAHENEVDLDETLVDDQEVSEVQEPDATTEEVETPKEETTEMEVEDPKGETTEEEVEDPKEETT